MDEKLQELYNKQREIYLTTPGIDCSELVENYLAEVEGTALLLLHPDWKYGSTFAVVNAFGDVEEYVYHYAYISDDDKVYDSMLGYSNVDIEDYLELTKVEGKILKTIVATKQLYAYI